MVWKRNIVSTVAFLWSFYIPRSLLGYELRCEYNFVFISIIFTERLISGIADIKKGLAHKFARQSENTEDINQQIDQVATAATSMFKAQYEARLTKALIDELILTFFNFRIPDCRYIDGFC